MLSIFPCYATRDKPFALDLAAFLERGAGMQVFAEDGEIGRGENIASKAADGLEAEVILLVLSPRATPAALSGTHCPDETSGSPSPSSPTV